MRESILIAVVLTVAVSLAAGCTVHHTKVPLADSHEQAPSKDAVFITEDDSGLALLGLFVITEPDHYAILVERARRRHNCAQLHHIQFDFYTDFWVFVGFPISRITAICEPAPAPPTTAHPTS